MLAAAVPRWARTACSNSAPGPGFWQSMERLIAPRLALPGCRSCSTGAAAVARIAAAGRRDDRMSCITFPASRFFDRGRPLRAPGGVVAMIEPWFTSWSRTLPTLHHEPFDPEAQSVTERGAGPLSAANGAFPWILFERDRAAFAQRCPQWHVETVRPMMIGRPELRTIEGQRRHQVGRREMRRERERQAERGGKLRAVGARSEQPERDARSGPGTARTAWPGCTGPSRACSSRTSCGKFSAAPARSRRNARAVRWSVPGARPRPRSMRSAVERLQRAELLRDHQRRVIRQHDAARSDTDGPGAAGNIADHHGRRGAGDAGHVVMLGEPESLEPPAFGVLREVERIAEGLGRIAALIDRRQIEDGKRNHVHLRGPTDVGSWSALCEAWRGRVPAPAWAEVDHLLSWTPLGDPRCRHFWPETPTSSSPWTAGDGNCGTPASTPRTASSSRSDRPPSCRRRPIR